MPTSQRIRRGAAATLSVQWTDTNDNPVAAAGAVTVGVTRADGSTLVASGTATLNPDTGLYTKALTAAQTATLDELTAVWSDAGSSTTRTTSALVVDGFAFSIAEIRSDEALANAGTYPDELLIDKRAFVEAEFERITLRAPTRRYELLRVDSTGDPELRTGRYDLAAVRSCRVYAYRGSTSYTDLTADQLARLVWDNDGVIARTDGGTFLEGRQNVLVGIEYGMDEIEADLRQAMLRRLRSVITADRSGIPDRAKTWQPANGGTFEIARASLTSTGIDDIDAVYDRFSRRSRGGKAAPVSKGFDMDPQRYSLFHGPRR